MRPVLSRAFLLLLLATDWAADPSMVAPALQPLARRWGNTTCFCHSAAHRETIRQVLTSAPELAPDCHALPSGQPQPFAPERREPPHTFHHSDLLYVLLSIRC